MSGGEVKETLAVLCRTGSGWDKAGLVGYIQCNWWRDSNSGEIAMRVAPVREGRHISGPAPTSPCIPMRVTSTSQRHRQRKGKTSDEPTSVRARGYQHALNHPTEPNQGEQDVARCSEDVRNAVGMRRKTVQIIRGICKGDGTDVDIDAQIKWEREKAEKRRVWEENFARRKEAERLRLAREELAREKKHRLDSWMSNGGDPQDFERAWPSMMQDIMEERYRSRQERAEDLFA